MGFRTPDPLSAFQGRGLGNETTMMYAYRMVRRQDMLVMQFTTSFPSFAEVGLACENNAGAVKPTQFAQ